MQPTHQVVPLQGNFDDPATVRRAAAVALHRVGCEPDLLGDTLLCLSELVTNAVLHAGGSICVEIRTTSDTVRLEVVDGVPAGAPGLRERAEARAALLAEGVAGELERETGRGLGILTQLSAAWGVDPEDVEGKPGKRVWVELSTARESGTGREVPAPSSLSPVARVAPAAPVAPVAPEGSEAVLVDVPIRLFLGSEAYLEALLRDMQLRAADWSARDDKLMKGLANALRRNATARITSLEEARRQIDAGHTRMTMRFPVSPSTPADAREFLDVVDLSETLTRGSAIAAGSDAALEELQHFRRWYVGEMIHQSTGGAPRPCPFRP